MKILQPLADYERRSILRGKFLKLRLLGNWQQKRLQVDYSYLLVCGGMKPLKGTPRNIPPRKFWVDKVKEWKKDEVDKQKMENLMQTEVLKGAKPLTADSSEDLKNMMSLKSKLLDTAKTLKKGRIKESYVMKGWAKLVDHSLADDLRVKLKFEEDYPVLCSRAKSAFEGEVKPIDKESYASKLMSLKISNDVYTPNLIKSVEQVQVLEAKAKNANKNWVRSLDMSHHPKFLAWMRDSDQTKKELRRSIKKLKKSGETNTVKYVEEKGLEMKLSNRYSLLKDYERELSDELENINKDLRLLTNRIRPFLEYGRTKMKWKRMCYRSKKRRCIRISSSEIFKPAFESEFKDFSLIDASDEKEKKGEKKMKKRKRKFEKKKNKRIENFNKLRKACSLNDQEMNIFRQFRKVISVSKPQTKKLEERLTHSYFDRLYNKALSVFYKKDLIDYSEVINSNRVPRDTGVVLTEDQKVDSYIREIEEMFNAKQSGWN